MPRINTHQKFNKSLLALAALAAMAPQGSWALDIAQQPPLPVVKSSYVAPNLIISVDDSGSMGFRVNQGNTNGATNETTPGPGGVWSNTARRMNVLKYALKSVFNDTNLIPPNKIRLGWQALHNNGNNANKYQDLSYWYGSGSNPGKGKDPGANNINGSVTGQNNYIRSLDATHRANFLSFVNYLLPNNGTPLHQTMVQADGYMRNKPLDINSAWASVPGTTAEPFLGCRRNYHIVMTDGRWNGTDNAIPDLTYRDNSTNLTLPDGKVYGGNTAGLAQTALYRDTSTNENGKRPIAEWAFYSWAKPLKTSGLQDVSTLKPPKDYNEAAATESYTAGGKKLALEKYWNPKYNPATWPHMVTYTIGFSSDAYTWPGASSIIAPTQMTPFGYDGSFPGFVTGTKTWPEMDAENKRALDLWHAALNGRGRFYAVQKAEDLEKAFREIIGVINEQSAQLPDTIGAGATTSQSNTTRENAGNFASAYNAKAFWKGWVSAAAAREPVDHPCPDDPSKTCTDYPDPTKAWQGKTTADRLDEIANLTDRVVWSWSDAWASTKYKGGVPFKWATDETNLSAPQKASLGKEDSDAAATTATKGRNILEYIRGERSLEGVNGPPANYTAAKPFRQRTSRQGDIINSGIWYVGAPISNYALPGYSAFAKNNKTRTPMLYVGGNDGMLHGFSAKDGKEGVAYVPRGVISNLKQLADPNYNHLYFVDGSPMSGDVDVGAGSSDWRTMLVGTLGAGGKGYFILDVTDPANFTDAKSKDQVIVDRTRGNNEVAPDCNRTGITTPEKNACIVAVDQDKDIGNITAKPVTDSGNKNFSTQVVRLNNNRWAVVMGNGYSSQNEAPVLLIQYLDGAKELKRIKASSHLKGAGNAKDNGLSAPTLVDLNGDNRVDVVYAGDNLGNLWKFDLTSNSDGDWAVAFGLDQPLFSARGPIAKNGTRNQPQPITAPAIVRPNDRSMVVSGKTLPVGGMMVAFGTGRNLTADDMDTTKTYNIQTLYSVLDNARYRIRDKSKPKDDQRLEIHPGDASKGIPIPAKVGTMGVDAKLAKQVTAVVSGTNETVNASDTANDLKAATWKNWNGWYLDFTEKGERMLSPLQFWDGSNILAVYSESPSGTSGDGDANAVESCTGSSTAIVGGSQWRNLINIMDGKKPTVQLVAGGAPQYTTRVPVPVGTPTLITVGNKIKDYTGVNPNNPDEKPREDNRMPEQSLRPSWRQIK